MARRAAVDRIDADGKSSAQHGRSPGLLERLLLLLAGSGDSERQKKRLLKQLGRSLTKSRQRYYKPAGRQVQPAMGSLFFGIYQVVGPAQHLLQHADESAGLRDIVVESLLTEDQKQLKEQFSEQQIRVMAETMEPRQLASGLKHIMVQFFSSFDNATVRRINNAYHRLRTFVDLARFDYYFLLKKFDSSMPELNFSIKPRFEPLIGDRVSEDLKDFIGVAYAVDTGGNWDAVFDMLNSYRGLDMVARPAWQKLLTTLDSLRTSNVLVAIVQHIDNDPYYKPVVAASREQIVESYLSRARTTAEAALQKISNERRTRRVEQLCRAVFGVSAVSRTRHYTDQANSVYSKRELAGFVYTDAVNYLTAFLLDYFKRDVRELVGDILLVRGQWSANTASQQLSEAFHRTLAISEQIVAFDDALADEGEMGARLKKAMGRIVDRNKASADQLRRLLGEVNDRAGTMINDAGRNLVVLARYLKAAIEDRDRDEHEVILNWKQLQSMSAQPLKQRLVEVYRKVHYFVQLMQICAKT
ncbi:MAG: hypothetical protein EA384_14890 [Spirochaetaceae bacterium]|nr:MAG: hypothetical protein EA384_14890 [Spirochaetaceae bacterium]